MSKKLLFLVSAAVLGLSGTAQAWTAIDDPNYNLSFEYDSSGDQIYCYHRVSCKSEWDPDVVSHCGVMGWLENNVDWPVVELPCSQSPDGEGCECKSVTWLSSDGLCNLTMGQYTPNPTDANLLVWQTLDPAYDANVIIQQDYDYRVSYDIFKWANPTLKAYLYYGYIPDNNSLDVDVNTIVEDEPNDVLMEPWKTYSIGFRAEAGQPYIGEPLGIRFFQTGSGWFWIDNVRVEYKSLTDAGDPKPADKEEWVARDVNLAWTPGLWTQDVNMHHVYFSNDESKVISRHQDANRGVQSVNDYNAGTLHALTLGTTYYWAIDEINDPCVFPGDVWEFKIDTGQARFPNPGHGAKDVDVNVVLSWQRGVDSNVSDIYFGPNQADVTAGTGGTAKPSTGGNTYDAGALQTLLLGNTYFWRIDAVNGVTGANWPGDVWKFTLINSLVVDDFDGYATKNDMTNVWTQISLALIDLVDGGTYPDLVHDGNSMEYYYDVSAQYSEIEANASLLEVGTDWVAGNPKALVLNFRGLSTNAGGNANRLYVGVEDGDGNVGVVPYDGDANDIKKETWQEWNVALSEFDACDVNLADVDKFYIGFGDRVAKPGGGGWGTVYFDTIELHPTRCVPSKIRDKGNFDNDCAIGYDDVAALGADWLLSEGAVGAQAPSVAPIILYDFEDTFGDGYADNTGSYGGTHDANLAGMVNPWTASGKDGNGLHFEVNDANYAVVEAPLNISTNKLTITAWLKRNGSQGFVDEGGFVGIVFTRDDPKIAAGLTFGAIGDFEEWAWWTGTNQLAYNWNNNQDAWEWQTQLIPPNSTWTFAALVVDGAKATIYMSDGVGAMQSATNYLAHSPEDFSTDLVQIGNDGSSVERAYVGDMDEVRIYDYALSAAEVLSLAGGGTYTLELVTDMVNDGTINFKDYDVLADNWLEEILWP